MCVCVRVCMLSIICLIMLSHCYSYKRDEPVWATVEDFCCAVSFIDHVTRFPLVNNVTPRCRKKKSKYFRFTDGFKIISRIYDQNDCII